MDSFSFFAIAFTPTAAIVYLLVTYRESRDFKTFIRLTPIKLILVGTLSLIVSYWLGNTVFYIPSIRPIPPPPPEEMHAPPSVPVITDDTLFYNPPHFVAYIHQVRERIKVLTRPLQEEERLQLQDVFAYWKGLSSERTGFKGTQDEVLGHYYLGIFAFEEADYPKATKLLEQVPDTFWRRNLLLGHSYQAVGNEKKAEHFFLKEAALLHSNDKAEAVSILSAMYLKQERDCDFYNLAERHPTIWEDVPGWRQRIMVWRCQGQPAYYLRTFRDYYQEITWGMVLSSAFMSLLWLIYFYKLDVFNKESIGLLLLTFGLEALLLVVLLFPWLDFQNMYFGVKSYEGFWLDFVLKIGLPEETIKILPVALMLHLFPKRWEEPYDLILLGVFSACAFAFMENMLYIYQYEYRVISTRTILSSLGHILFTSMACYGWIQAKHRQANGLLQILLWFFLAILAHAAYDYFLRYNLSMLTVLLLFFGLTFLAVAINNCINSSKHFHYHIWWQSIRFVELLVLGFLGLFVYEYFVLIYIKGTEIANGRLIAGIFEHSFLLFFVTTKLSSFDLVKGYWKEFGFFNHSQEFQSRQKLNPFVWIIQLLLANSIYPQNFIGLKLKIKAHFHSKWLVEAFQGLRQGAFIDRVILKEYEKVSATKSVARVSSKYFLIMLNYPIELDGFSSPLLLLRFRSESVSLGSMKNQSVKLYFVDDLKKLKEPETDIQSFPYLGMGVVELDETFVEG